MSDVIHSLNPFLIRSPFHTLIVNDGRNIHKRS